jgi:DNA-binding IclR family transcriptional regulator
VSLGSEDDGRAQPRILTSVIACFSLLEFMSGMDKPARLSDLARQTQTSKGTLHQRLATLVEVGWVEQSDGGRYRLTTKAFRVGHGALEQSDIGSRIRPCFESLARTTGETTSLAVLDGAEALIVDRIDSDHVLRLDIRVGVRLPLAESASGRVLMAYCGDHEQERLRRAGVPLLSEDLLAKIRAEGLSVSVNERWAGVFAAAAPVFGTEGRLLAAVVVSGPVQRYDPQRVADAVTTAARDMSTAIAGSAHRSS